MSALRPYLARSSKLLGHVGGTLQATQNGSGSAMAASLLRMGRVFARPYCSYEQRERLHNNEHLSLEELREKRSQGWDRRIWRLLRQDEDIPGAIEMFKDMWARNQRRSGKTYGVLLYDIASRGTAEQGEYVYRMLKRDNVPIHPGLLRDLVTIFSKVGDASRCLGLCKEVAQQVPPMAQTWVTVIEVLLRRRHIDTIFQLLEEEGRSLYTPFLEVLSKPLNEHSGGVDRDILTHLLSEVLARKIDIPEHSFVKHLRALGTACDQGYVAEVLKVYRKHLEDSPSEGLAAEVAWTYVTRGMAREGLQFLNDCHKDKSAPLDESLLGPASKTVMALALWQSSLVEAEEAFRNFQLEPKQCYYIVDVFIRNFAHVYKVDVAIKYFNTLIEVEKEIGDGKPLMSSRTKDTLLLRLKKVEGHDEVINLLQDYRPRVLASKRNTTIDSNSSE